MEESEEELKRPVKGERGISNNKSEKAGLKLNIPKTEIMASSPITSWPLAEDTWKQWQILFSWAPKPLWTVTAAMKLKWACSLGEKLWST